MELNNHILLFISLSSLLLSANAICVPRNFSYLASVACPPAPSPAPTPAQVDTSASAPDVSASAVSAPSLLDVSNSITSKITGLLSPLLGSSPTTKDNPEVKKVCDVSEDSILCASSIIPFLNGAFDPASILRSEIQAGVNFTQKTIAKAKELATDESLSKYEKECLQQCQTNYDSVLDNFKSAADAIGSNDVGTLRTMLSAAISDLEACDDAFRESPGAESPLTEFDDVIHKLAGICLDIANKLFHI
ncbi:pectinesterase inhibitor-like [Fagus crenata]